nr:hypothetical protein [Tanacetum cinerariifolium]
DLVVGNKMHKAFPLLGESSHWQYKFSLPVKGVPTASRMEIPLPGVCTAMMKKLPESFSLSIGFQYKFNAEKAGEEVDQAYMLFPVWSAGSPNPQNNAEDAAFDGKEHDFDVKKPESEVILSPSCSAQSKEQDDMIKKEAKGKIPTVGHNSLNSTNTFSAAGPSNDAVSPTDRKYSFIDASQLLDDPYMPELEDIIYSDDEDVVGAEADFNNLEYFILHLLHCSEDLENQQTTQEKAYMLDQLPPLLFLH